MNTVEDVRLRYIDKTEGLKSKESTLSPSEQHHSGHALMFLYIAIHQTLTGERIRRRLLGRIIHHLMDLREFIVDPRLTELVNELRLSLEKEYDQSLGFLLRTFHREVKGIVRWMPGIKRDRVYQSLNSFLIACCENQRVATTCLYPWLVGHQDKILELARYYGRESLFGRFIPIPKIAPEPQPVTVGHEIDPKSFLNQSDFGDSVSSAIKGQIYAFFRRNLENDSIRLMTGVNRRRHRKSKVTSS